MSDTDEERCSSIRSEQKEEGGGRGKVTIFMMGTAGITSCNISVILRIQIFTRQIIQLLAFQPIDFGAIRKCAVPFTKV